jgi:4-hydroxy-3-polyprenylbenzoate decarboxylase
MQRRGDKVAHVAIAIGADPLSFSTFVSKMGKPGEDEFEIAGGLRGKPVEVVKCESSDLVVPAQAEMIIEGEVPLDDMEQEGPYAEMFGFIGKAYEQRWYMNVKAITHRRNPWFVNSFTAVTVDGPGMAWAAENRYKYAQLIPNLVDLHMASNNIGVCVLSIDKQMAGQGLLAGMNVAANHVVVKVTIVVDKDVDVCNREEVMRSLGSRWQPRTASTIVNYSTNPGAWMDPSAPVQGVSSQIIIDATRQFPGEGGPKHGEPISRAVLEEKAGDAFKLVNQNWQKYLAGWQR